MDFEPFPKIPRLNRDIVITEKIDGTNAAVLIEDVSDFSFHGVTEYDDGAVVIRESDQIFRVQAQSRKRLITPEDDNFGFARWVRENAEELVRLMGPGRHFGEWWGQGIQRGYGQNWKKFWLFNPTFRFGLDPDDSLLLQSATVSTVPVLYEGPFATGSINVALHNLGHYGSEAAPGFMSPEGIIIFHTASRSLFKVTCKDDEKPKGATE